MRVGVVIPTYDRYGDAQVIRRLIVEAETLGYDSVWFSDHILVPGYATQYTDPHWYECLSCVLVGMGLTSRLQFGTDVLVAPYRNPILLAKMAATAMELSAGRLMLGLGVGFLEGEFEALGTPPFRKRGAVTDEYLRVMRLLFEGCGPLSYEGEWIRFSNMYFGPVPSNAPPLLIGGNHEHAIERAARLGDGWHPLFTSPEIYARGRDQINDIRNRAGLGAQPFTFSYSCPRTRLLQPGESPPAPFSQKDRAPADYAYVPEAPYLDQRQRFIGTAEQLSDDVAAYAAAGVQQIVLRFALPHDADITIDRIGSQWRAFAERVLPFCRTL